MEMAVLGFEITPMVGVELTLVLGAPHYNAVAAQCRPTSQMVVACWLIATELPLRLLAEVSRRATANASWRTLACLHKKDSAAVGVKIWKSDLLAQLHWDASGEDGRSCPVV